MVSLSFPWVFFYKPAAPVGAVLVTALTKQDGSNFFITEERE